MKPTQNTTPPPTDNPKPSVIEPAVVRQEVRPNVFKRALTAVVFLLVLALAGGGAYYYQQSKVDDLQASKVDLEGRVSTLQSALEDKGETTEEEAAVTPSTPQTPAADATTSDLIPGDTDTRRADGRILVGAIFKYSLNPTELWVEYGTSPESLDKATTKMNKGLGMGMPGSIYSQGFSAAISNADLTPGGVYYYRTAATVDGKTMRSAVASFTTDK